MNKKKIGLIVVVIGVICIIMGIISIIPKKQPEINHIDVALNDKQLQFLIKEMQKYLSPAEDINKAEPFTEQEMIQFAFSYIAYLDSTGSKTSIDENTSIGIASVQDIKTNVTHLFGVDNIDMNKVEYEVKDEKIYIPLNLQGGDAQIYKYKKTTYNDSTKEYIAEIACLDISSPDDKSTLLETSEFNEENVICTLSIKYKVVDGRKVLLAYSIHSNLEY